jgi:hypothetical protein
MTYILLWFLCAYCAYKLLKNYVSANLRLVGIPDASIAQAMRNAAKKDDSIEEIYNATDNTINAAFWTVVLVVHLAIWPICLVQLVVWQTIDKQDFSDFRG